MLYALQYEEDGTKLYLGSIYSHGELHGLMDVDMLTTDDIQLYNDVMFTKHDGDYFTYETKAMDRKGIEHDVEMFLYVSKIFKKYNGLVCLSSDQESITDARDKMERKEDFI